MQAIIMFSAYQDSVIGRLAYQFSSWKSATKTKQRYQVEREINEAIQSAEDAAAILGETFPGLEDLITRHNEDAEE